MLKRMLMLLAGMLLATSAWADVAYMRDGTIHRGKVTRDGNTVRIDMDAGQVVVNAADVLYIATSRPATPATKPAPPAAPTAPPIGPTSPPPVRTPAAKIVGDFRPISIRFQLSRVTRPESIIFMLMRNLAATPPGDKADDFRKQIAQWQIAAHDRKRKMTGRWYTPGDFVRRRQAYVRRLSEAADFAKRARAVRGDTAKDKSERSLLETECNRRLVEAAKCWPDPLIRYFLTGIAYYRSKSYQQAVGIFRECCEQAPRVAGLHQGYGLALLESNRGTDALAEFIRTLQLQPDSSEALDLLIKGMQKVPGAQTRSVAYIRALKLRKLYDTSGSRRSSYSRGTKWLMPEKGRSSYGRGWTDRDGTLPMPPYDRLVFRQAVGVPIAKDTLLVDESVVKNALAVFVQINETTIVPVATRRTTYYSSYRTKTPRPPLSTLRVEGYTFTPAAGEEPPKPVPKTDVVLYGLGIFEEMGSRVRAIPALIAAVDKDGGVKLTEALSAGDAAGPILSVQGRLLGFLAAKPDAMVADGGPNVLIPYAHIEPLVEKARKPSRSYSGYGRAKRKPTDPVPAPGKYFTVHGIFSETFE